MIRLPSDIPCLKSVIIFLNSFLSSHFLTNFEKKILEAEERSVNEPGFIYKFEEYDYSVNGAKVIHRHKYDRDTINQLLNQIFDRVEVTAQ